MSKEIKPDGWVWISPEGEYSGDDDTILIDRVKNVDQEQAEFDAKLGYITKPIWLSSTPPVPVELLSWVKKTRKAYWRIGNKEHPEVYELEDAMLEAFEQLDSILPAVGEKKEGKS